MADRFAPNSIQIICIGLTGIAIAAVSYRIGTHTGGLAEFSVTIASLGIVTLTFGVGAAQTVEHLTNPQRRRMPVDGRSANEPARTARPGHRCGICNSQRVRHGATLVCPNCDDRHNP